MVSEFLVLQVGHKLASPATCDRLSLHSHYTQEELSIRNWS